jgi:hypothetical protein
MFRTHLVVACRQGWHVEVAIVVSDHRARHIGIQVAVRHCGPGDHSASGVLNGPRNGSIRALTMEHKGAEERKEDNPQQDTEPPAAEILKSNRLINRTLLSAQIAPKCLRLRSRPLCEVFRSHK